MVWNTTQSATYEAERRCDKCTEEERAGDRRLCPPQKKRMSLFDDGDTILIFALILFLMREKSDQKLIFSLLIALLM